MGAGGKTIECARFANSRPPQSAPRLRGPFVEQREEAPRGQNGRSLHRLAQQEPDDDLRHSGAWDGMGGKREEEDPGELLA